MTVRTKELSALFQSGIIAQDAKITEAAQGGGNTANMPLFKDLTGVSEVLSDTVPLTVNKITTDKDIAVKHFRGKAWGSNDLASALAGADPMAAIADLVAAWWARDMQATLFATLKGMFAASSMSAATVDISLQAAGTVGDVNRISAPTTINAFATLGDAGGALSAIAMHSAIYYSLMKQDLITFEHFSEQGVTIQRYLGKQVIVDDTLPTATETNQSGQLKYTSYLFGNGAVGYGEGAPEEAVEMDRDILLGEEYLVNRRHFVLHPLGVKWAGTAAGVSPTNTELGTGTNWVRVYEQKNVPLVRLITNG